MHNSERRILVLPLRASIPRGFSCDVELAPISRDPVGSALSPFFLGPCSAPDGLEFQNMENLWQYSKVYKHLGHLVEDGPRHNLPSDEYMRWRADGAARTRADRYPAGRGVRPAYSYWPVTRWAPHLDYVAARKTIYIPEYARLARHIDLYKDLRAQYKKGARIVLRDFDAYSLWDTDLTYVDVIENPKRKMGHAFVLAMMLELGTHFYRGLLVRG
ncbi:hypothetical protein [Ralstonia phage phiRSL1]|uniref:Uncharacterized protein n=1 Tax=Ralstonia phage phiRSL1 TaxID=1980924 RepID=B2ZXV6_9CAUD|nr:hypothetical protein RSL1_ORF086 [Ralstonia phage phiRSL1]BAG41532.1 hypothetical protein [Ralstonia phage phiRSL1]